jgi:hypothetical protein
MQSWLGRFDGYRVTVTEDRVTNWLVNFRDEDRDLGARVLDAVTFIKSEDMEAALRDMVNRLPGWHRSKACRRGKWRFVAFSISAGESGDLLLHRSRTALGLAGRQFDELFIHKAELLSQGLGAEDNVVFFDDFAGTGQQACRAWRGDPDTKVTGLAELLPGNPKTYLILIAAGQRAVSRIAEETEINLLTKYTLGPADDIFSTDCQHFTQPEKENLLTYCERADRKTPRGYGNCGFVIVLAHKTPNNSIPILHANHRRWTGLFPRY